MGPNSKEREQFEAVYHYFSKLKMTLTFFRNTYFIHQHQILQQIIGARAFADTAILNLHIHHES